MEEDLILGSEEAGEEEEFEYYEPDLHSEITSAYNALAAIETIDEQMLSGEMKRKVKSIRRKSLEIIFTNINDIHADVFGRNEIKETEEE